MKKTLIVTITLICLIFTSCKKENNSSNDSSNNSYNYDFVIDNIQYTWSGAYKVGSPPAATFFKQGTNQTTNVSITKSVATINDFSIGIITDIQAPGVITCDLNSGSKNAINVIVGGKQYSSLLGNCKLQITKFDTENKVIKGSIQGEVGLYDINGNTLKITGTFSLPLINVNQ